MQVGAPRGRRPFIDGRFDEGMGEPIRLEGIQDAP
jgi:hypothetical protein